MRIFSAYTFRGLETLLHKELTAAMPKENIFPFTAPGVVSGTAHTELPLWRAKTSLFATSFRYRLLGPVLCSTLSDFRQRMRSEIDWSQVSFSKFRVHTKKSTLMHDGALLRILKEEAAKMPKQSEIPLQGDVVHVEVINDNLEVSLQTWSETRASLPLHVSLLKAGLIEIVDRPASQLPAFPLFDQLSVPAAFPKSWSFNHSLGPHPEFFFRTVRDCPSVGLGFADDRKTEKQLIQNIKTANKDIFVITRTKSNFDMRSGLVWRPEIRWDDERGVWWELLRNIR
jgi:hypothetical protein